MDKTNNIDIEFYKTEVLGKIHDSLTNFVPKEQLQNEIPEQILASLYIKPNDVVLELGGSLGRNSCVINSILQDKTQHVVIEPSIRELEILKHNRDANNLKFHIENSAISDHPLYSLNWYTYNEPIENSVQVNTITYTQLQEKYPLNFNVLVIDNEGHFVEMLKAFPELLNGIRLVIIEHDFNTLEDLEYFYNTMNDYRFKLSCNYLKTFKYGPGMDWIDGLKEDPIFASAWTR